MKHHNQKTSLSAQKAIKRRSFASSVASSFPVPRHNGASNSPTNESPADIMRVVASVSDYSSPDSKEKALTGLRTLVRLADADKYPKDFKTPQLVLVPLFRLMSQKHVPAEAKRLAAVVLQNLSAKSGVRIVASWRILRQVLPLLRQRDTRQPAVNTVYNIAKTETKLRDGLLDRRGVSNGLIHCLLDPQGSEQLRQDTVDAILILCGGFPKPKFLHVSVFIQPIMQCIQDCQKLWTGPTDLLKPIKCLVEIFDDRESDPIQDLCPQNFLDFLYLLLEVEPTLTRPIVVLFGVLAVGNSMGVIQTGFLHLIPKLLEQSEKPKLLTATCWTLGTIAAQDSESGEAIRHIFNVGILKNGHKDCEILQKLLPLAQDGEWKIRKEATMAVCYMILGGTVPHVYKLLEMGACKILVQALGCEKDPEVRNAALGALGVILGDDGWFGYKRELHEEKLEEKIQDLQRLENLDTESFQKINRLANVIAASENETPMSLPAGSEYSNKRQRVSPPVAFREQPQQPQQQVQYLGVRSLNPF